MLIKIRPSKLFTLLPEEGWQHRTLNVVFPRDQGSWLLDTAILVALGRLLKVKYIFEFGTSIGINAWNLVNNVNLDKLYTLDIKNRSPHVWYSPKPKVEKDMHFRVKQSIEIGPIPARATIIKCLIDDSRKFDTGPLKGKIDMVFIDGGHDYLTVASDTIKAMEMLDMVGGCVLAWHDYNNNPFPGVKKLVDEYSDSMDIFYVEDSLMAFAVFGKPEISDGLNG